MRDESFFETPTRSFGQASGYHLGRFARWVARMLGVMALGVLSYIASVILLGVWWFSRWGAIGSAISVAAMASAHMTLGAYGFGALTVVFIILRVKLGQLFRPQVMVAAH